MARFLVIDADGPNIALVAASAVRGGVKLEQVLTWTLDAPPSLANAEAIGRTLRDKLAAARISAAPLVVGVGRERVIFKEIKHPAVPAHEEPAVVRFQAIKELTESPDEVIIDYQPRSGQGGERRALVVAAKKEVVRLAQVVAQAAGLKLHAVVPRPFALAAVARAAVPAPEPGEAYAVLAVGATGGEFLVARGEELLFARPVTAPALATDQALLSELRRNLAVHSGQNPHAPVRALYIAEGSTLRGFADRVKATLAVPVVGLDPLAASGLASTGAPGHLAGAVGLARIAAAGDAPINFIKPREPKGPKDPHRRPMLFGAALAAAVVFALAAIAWLQISSRDRVIADLRRDLDGVSSQLTELEPLAKRHDEVRKWLNSQVVWLDEIYDLAARFPDLTKLRLTQLTADPIPLPPNPRKDGKHYVARVSLEGMTTDDSRPLSKFMDELASETAYKVEAKNTKPLQSGADRRSFSNQFSVRYEIERRAPESFSRTFAADAPARKSRGGGGGRPGGNIINQLLGGMGP